MTLFKVMPAYSKVSTENLKIPITGGKGGFKRVQLSGKESVCQCTRCRFNPWVRKIPWRRKWQPTSISLPGKSHEQSLAGYSLWGHKELGMTEQLSTHACAIDTVDALIADSLYCAAEINTTVSSNYTLVKNKM